MVQAMQGSLAEAVERAAALLATDPPGAERRARAILGQAPNDPRARLILASARRRQGDPAGALALLEPLVQAFPNAARTRFEVGMCLAALGRTPAAVEALRKATALDPQIAEAWRAMGDLLFMQGDIRAAEAAFAQHMRASVRDPRLQPAAASILSGRINEAESHLRRHLTANPDDPEALALLADIFVRQSRRAHAEIALEKCVALA
ncbi:MAG: tetratricopeptide repeat protein, partial [Proteobacteria bacterium]|nr:tetratricopeptide repeat protein [Pseudomonadota bacterium]